MPMVFSSHLFFYYFLPATLAVYYLVPRRARNGMLALASYLFYGWANPAFTLLMLGSTLVDYVCGRLLGSTEPAGRRRALVATSVVTNLALLGFFKYFNFAVDSWNAITTGFGAAGLDTALRVTLPLGISFYTFQSMSYTLDVYRRRSPPLANFIDFACYVSLFPQLVAGPIVRFSEIAEQLASRRETVERFARGAVMLSLGMAKKILLANPCGRIADTVFDAGSRAALDAWYGVAAYSFQIYFDFSGYSDMAIGLGLLLGFVLPKNFASPYRATSLTDFWRRWHISLSTWLRDYLYLPLGGNRRGAARTYLNLGLVMLLGGLWHGAAWRFAVWGAIHGAFLSLERALGWGKAGADAETGVGAERAPVPRLLRAAATYLVVLVAWVFFRAADVSAALDYLGAMLGFGQPQAGAVLLGGLIYRPYYLLAFAVAAAVVWLAPQSWDVSRRLTPAKGVAALALLALALVAMASQGYNPFIYFIF